MHNQYPGSPYVWAGGAVLLVALSFVLFLQFVPKPGQAEGLSRTSTLLALLEKIPEAKLEPTKEQSKVEMCRKRVTDAALRAACCNAPLFENAPACTAALEKTPANKTVVEPEKTDTTKTQNTTSDVPLTPQVLKLLPSLYQQEYRTLDTQAKKLQATEDKLKDQVETMRDCELSCPGGGYAITCTAETRQTCIDHDACITNCDKGYNQLIGNINKLNKDEATFTKKAQAFQKKVNTYRDKNQRKFRAVEGSSH